MLPKISGYARSIEKKHLSFLIKVDQLLKKYNEVQDKVKLKNNL